MPTPVAPEAHGDERGALLAYLDAQRGGLRRAVHGLTEEQARATPSASALSVAGLLKHVAQGEAGWIRTMTGDPVDFNDPRELARWERSFLLEDGEDVASVLAFYAEVAAGTERVVRALPSLDETFVLPAAPWDAGGERSWRWGLLHLIEEAARHAGHADVIRETLDGKGAFDLVFETGALPEPDWSALTGPSAA
ncbi:DinB family protein [Streptomyces sp. TRM 70351]|uniref:DinB family protein n=1 Tax=Streptomyces sp. TRM 70351 TaxID=3116552 RepID=UPI002E7C280A|nr:DinB family protein [Streptomyces sp. TRM 70351]MEE1930351.1 DinB family protein [Streptomyces sp. TRM 70351]